jgi:nephrocystin-3
MPSARDLRVFISSTFRDLQEEREHLVRKVFPEIRALCRARGITFTEVDLRWGLTDEDVVLGQVIRTCLEEIDRCRPYFIGITGERYGYVPDLVDIYKDAELLARYPWIEDAAMEGSSIIDLEFRHAALNDGNEHARFFFRRTRRGHEADVPEEERAKIEALRRRVRDAGLVVEEFRDPASLGEMVYDELRAILDRDFADRESPDALETERRQHEAFAASRRRAYIPNPEYLADLNAWLGEPSAPPIVIYAESGSGKSSLVSFWCEQLRRRQPLLPVIEHYVGIGAGSSDHYAIMKHVMEEIRIRFSRTEEIPAKPEEIERAFANWLGYTIGEPLLLVIDGINQLSGRALDLQWLPPVVPAGVKLVITSTVEQTLVDLRSRKWRELAMQPLKEREREGVVVRYLSEFHKALSKEQVERIAEDAKCAHPLFLRTLMEELRLDSSHDTLDARITSLLRTSGTEDLFQKVLERMEDDFGTRSVREVMSCIWCSRTGLSEEELHHLTGLSRLKLSILLVGLDYHLVTKDGALTFFHDYLRRAVAKRYLAGEDAKAHYRQRLSEYFASAGVTLRSTRELLFAAEMLGQQRRLVESLSEIQRFVLMWSAEPYEVLRLLASEEPAAIAASLASRLDEWVVQAAPTLADQSIAVRALTGFLIPAGGWEVADRLWAQEFEIRKVLGDHDAQGIALVTRSRLALLMGRIDEAMQLALDASASSEGIQPGTLAMALACRANVHLLRGEAAAALACVIEQEAIASNGELRNLTQLAHLTRGNIYRHLGELDAAMESYLEAESRARELGDRNAIATAIGNQALVQSQRAEYDEALDSYSRQEAIAYELGDRVNLMQILGGRAAIHAVRGDHDAALRAAERLGSLSREVGNPINAAHAANIRGIALQSIGDFEAALNCYQESASIARGLDYPYQLQQALSNIGNLYAELGHFEEAEGTYEELASLISKDNSEGLAYVAGNRGCWRLSQGDFDDALSLLDIADAQSRDASDWASVAHWQVARADALLSRAAPLRSNSNGDVVREALTALEEASGIASRSGLLEIAYGLSVMRARCIAARGEPDTATSELKTLLSAASSDAQRADAHYWLWKLGLEPAVDHRAAAEQLYAELFSRIPKHGFRVKLDELRADASTATPSEERDAVTD